MTPLNALVLAVTLLNPVRTYFQPHQPIVVNLDTAALAKLPGVDQAAPLKLALLGPDGHDYTDAPVDRAKPRIDLATAFSNHDTIWDGQTYFVQLVAGDEPVGSPLVVVPLIPPNTLSGLSPVIAAVVQPGAVHGVPPDALRIEPEKLVEFDTSLGKIVARLDPAAAPNTVMHFEMLVAGGFYTNVIFHRVVPDFVIQGGDPTGAGRGGPGYFLNLESSDKPHTRGTLSMAREGNDVNTNGSQFFICLSRQGCQSLDQKYSAFGDVAAGMDVVDKIAALPVGPSSDRPADPAVIQEAKLIPAPPRPIGKTPPAELAEP